MKIALLIVVDVVISVLMESVAHLNPVCPVKRTADNVRKYVETKIVKMEKVANHVRLTVVLPTRTLLEQDFRTYFNRLDSQPIRQ